ncbi:MAG TPA: hypothetical protein VI749_06990 [Candidatus Omnitrophota bacterium]|nr:hypothetical protein [Candidatus Omnitrophota bacterium]
MIYSILIGIILLEVAFIALIKYLHRDFQWLITEADELPALDKQGLEKFFNHGFDGQLGWVRRPHTSGAEKARDVRTTFTIDAKGGRTNPLLADKEETIATFGDSYNFCRQVNDDETWQVYLTQLLGIGVSNYGVGNYGVDQTLLRYERTQLADSVKIVIFSFVPETICRVQSYWKHYLEFGNTFAFKPRFVLKDGQLELLPNVMQTQEDFRELEPKLRDLRKNDGFYASKFRHMQFRFPYTLSYFRNFKRNSRLIASLIVRVLARSVKRSNSTLENRPFQIIMEGNIDQAHQMYSDKESCALLKSILMRFKAGAEGRGHQPVIVVIPQLMDLKRIVHFKRGSAYRPFYQEIGKEMTVIDLSDFILKQDLATFYTEDLYGGHITKKGNQLIAQYLAEVMGEKVFEVTGNKKVSHAI